MTNISTHKNTNFIVVRDDNESNSEIATAEIIVASFSSVIPGEKKMIEGYLNMAGCWCCSGNVEILLLSRHDARGSNIAAVLVVRSSIATNIEQPTYR